MVVSRVGIARLFRELIECAGVVVDVRAADRIDSQDRTSGRQRDTPEKCSIHVGQRVERAPGQHLFSNSVDCRSTRPSTVR